MFQTCPVTTYQMIISHQTLAMTATRYIIFPWPLVLGGLPVQGATFRVRPEIGPRAGRSNYRGREKGIQREEA